MKALKTYFALSIVFTFQNIVLAAVPYTAKNSTEAVLTFSHRVELISDASPSKATASDHINYQLQHMFGPMSVAETAAVPKEDYEIQITRIQLKEEYENVFEIFYDYKGTIVLASGPQKNYSFLLPVNPALIYEAGMQRNAKINRCTDEHYQNEDDFWYFWNPYQENCSLVEGEDFDVVNGTIERLPNTDRTYPEYDRLADENGVITIDEYFGLGDETTDPANVNPYESQDVNAPNYTATAHNLRAMGFESRVLEKEDIAYIVSLTNREMPYIEELTKTYSSGLSIVVRLFFGATGIDEKSKAFHYHFKDSLKNASVMIYDGHSGLGGHLDLEAIAEIEGFRITPNPNRYQIYFFNSCTSYTYYNTLYFTTKVRPKSNVDSKGTKNLDIMTNGLSTLFEVMHDTNMRLIRAIDLYAARNTWTSYQRLATDIDSDNLFGVNGDEDNPVQPRR